MNVLQETQFLLISYQNQRCNNFENDVITNK